ncbi:hypothetical protein FVE85_0801 [Porphyridium purpureum]|uniref:Centromere protein X n=1 Tax=Porphyridium purpureum TaxID=35688 RepID=A0A5J4Z1P2_PORPP|nr:hypothetical protein FVE85_0801 [Porphyridium purpureum]|eukprot:POR3796..scf208_2
MSDASSSRVGSPSSQISNELVVRLVRGHDGSPTKWKSESAIALTGVVLDALVREALVRGSALARQNGEAELGVQHIEAIAVQLLLDWT